MSTRQATPGPSNCVSLKRAASSETDDSTCLRPSKKTKKEKSIVLTGATLGFANGIASMSKKDGKKRKKKRRKSPIVGLEHHVANGDRSRKTSAAGRTIDVATPVANAPEPPTPTIPEPAPGPTEIDADSESDSDGDRDNPPASKANKGKGRARTRSLTPAAVPATEEPTGTENALTSLIIASTSDQPSTSAQAEAQAAEIARLTEQLAGQATLLQRHQNQINSIQQSLTCQICLDLLHRPYALSPCGHITCYPCLLRWFTANPSNQQLEAAPIDPQTIVSADLNNPPASGGDPSNIHDHLAMRQYLHRRKTCPVCRADVPSRPIEVYSVKGMVASLVRSQLIDLPVPPEAMTVTIGTVAPDPWNNIFHPASRRGPQWPAHLLDMFPARRQPARAANENPRANPEEMGWYDEDDGGIYRCLDCMYEIYGRHCSNCEREYPGHAGESDDESDEEYGHLWRGMFGGGGGMAWGQEEDYSHGESDEDEPAFQPFGLDSDSDNEEVDLFTIAHNYPETRLQGARETRFLARVGHGDHYEDHEDSHPSDWSDIEEAEPGDDEQMDNRMDRLIIARERRRGRNLEHDREVISIDLSDSEASHLDDDQDDEGEVRRVISQPARRHGPIRPGNTRNQAVVITDEEGDSDGSDDEDLSASERELEQLQIGRRRRRRAVLVDEESSDGEIEEVEVGEDDGSSISGQMGRLGSVRPVEEEDEDEEESPRVPAQETMLSRQARREQAALAAERRRQYFDI